MVKGEAHAHAHAMRCFFETKKNYSVNYICQNVNKHFATMSVSISIKICFDELGKMSTQFRFLQQKYR